MGERRIPSLDGWRGLGISVVLCSHLLREMVGPWREWLSLIAHLAMTMFFVVSGYLITGLLAAEEKRTGQASLRRFYGRRFWRIVPPLAVYLAVLATLQMADWRSLFTSASFSFGYSPWGTSRWLAHTWSLSMEEQFYLTWPLLLVAAGRRRAGWVAAALMALEPAARVADAILFPARRGMIVLELHTRGDALMAGCLAALLCGDPTFERWARRMLQPRIASAAGVFLLAISPLLVMNAGGAYRYPLGLSLEALAMLLLVLYSVRIPGSMLGRVLNWRPLVHLGLISYGVYIWQELFCTGPPDIAVRRFPLNLICAVAAGQISWMTIEAWSRRMRARLGRRETVAGTAVAVAGS